MKYLIFSDIHGASDSVEFLLDVFEKEQCDQMICLGDVLYHGPRNDLPNHYNPKKCISLLNPYSDKIKCVKGNCEAYVDQMVLNFKIEDELDMEIFGKKFHFEHGHFLDNKEYDADIIMYGHTHISKCEEKNNHIYINPGSITIPKENTKRGYIIIDELAITAYSMDKDVIFSYKF